MITGEPMAANEETSIGRRWSSKIDLDDGGQYGVAAFMDVTIC